jgi:hypothetical protein
MAEHQPHSEPRQPPPRRRRRRRIVLFSLLGALVLLGLLVALTPMLASGYVPAAAQSGINDAIQGRATVASASLSWFGPQRIGPIDIVDLDGRPVANIEIESSRGLFAILGIVTGAAPMDLGTTTVTGSASVIRRRDGTIHLVDVFQPTPPSQPPQDVFLPTTLSGRFVLDGLDVTFVDERELAQGSPAAVIRVPALTGEASITDATSAEASLGGQFFYGSRLANAITPGGSLELSAGADGLTETNGKLVLEKASYNARMDVVDMSIAIADVLAEMEGRLVQAIGDQLQMRLRLEGTLADGRLLMVTESPGAQADLLFETVQGVLRTAQPARVSLREGALAPLIPGFTQAIAAQDDVTFDRLPGATLTLDVSGIRLPVSPDASGIDLRGGAFSLSLQTGETVGHVRVPQPDGAPGPPRQYRLAPLHAQISSADLADRITIEARTRAMLGGESAGALEVDLTALEPLDEQGRPRPALARDITGQASLTGFATVILQPFVEGLGLNMAQDIGPELDLVMRAAASPAAPPVEAQQTPESLALPPTELSFQMRSENINAVAGFLLDGGVLMGDQRGAQGRLGTLAPLMTRLLQEQGVIVDSGAGMTLTAHDLRIDFNRLLAEAPAEKQEQEAGLDLRALSGLVRLELTPTAGRVLSDLHPPRTFELAPGFVALDAGAMDRGVRIQAATSARVDGQPAGELDVDLRLMQLLGPDGSPRPGIPALEGRAALSGIASALAEPLAEGLDVQRGIGPRFNIAVLASIEAGEPGQLPRSLLEVNIGSDGVSGSIPLALEAGVLRTRGEGVLRVRSPGVLLGPAAWDAGLDISDGGFLRITMRDVRLLIEGDMPLMERIDGEVELALGGFSVRPTPTPADPPTTPTTPTIAPPPDPLALQQVFVTAQLGPGAAEPVVMLRGSASHSGGALFMQGSLRLPGLLGPGGEFDLAQARPIGTLELRNLPSSLVHFAMTPDPQATLDGARLVQDLLGPSININLDASSLREGGPSDRRIALAARSQYINGQVVIDLDPRAMHLRQLDFAGTIAPELAGTLLQASLGEELATRPRVAQPARLTIAMQPVTIPLADGLTPDLSGAGIASLSAALQGRLIVENLVMAATAEQPQRPIGALGLQDFTLRAEFPLASLAPDTPPARTRFLLSGTVLGAPDRALMNVRSEGQATIADGRPVDSLNLEARLEVTDGWRLDQILGQDGMLAQAVGASMSIQTTATMQFAPAGALPAQPEALGFQRASLHASLAAPRLSTAQPLQLTILPDRLMLDAPANIRWEMHHQWANRFVLGLAPEAQPTPHEARFIQPVPVQLTISRLALSRGEGVGPLRRGIFAAQAQVTAATAQMQVGGVPTPIAGLDARIVGGHEDDALGFNIRIDDVGGGPGPGGQPAVHFTGGIYRIADALGHPTPQTALMSVQGAAHNVPTAIVDGFAQQGGLLVDGLGPAISLTVEGRGISEASGALRAVATSERGRAELSGIMQGTTFIADEPARVSLSVITPELGQRLTYGLPLVGHLEKTSEEEAAVLTVTNLILPLDGDMRRLSGELVFDPGEARFAVSRPFAPLLRLIDEPVRSVIGRRLQPITLSVREGVMTYDRFNIPVGEFTFAMQGNVDLVNRRLDVVTFVPFGALTEQAAGDLRSGLGGILGVVSPSLEELTMVPFRARGEFGRFSIEPDLQLMARELQRQLVRPDRILGGTARDILERLTPRRDNDNDNPQPPR